MKFAKHSQTQPILTYHYNTSNNNKMAIEIEITSEEIIKPLKYKSLKPYKLCMLDQLAPSFYVPIVLFYSSPDHNNLPNPKTSINNNIKIQRLKFSLAKTLETFYPFAGRISGDVSHVETGPNDGVLFKEARVVGVDLTTVLEKPDPRLAGRLLPIDPYAGDDFPVTAVQSNAFRCGGLALGICVSHKIADGATISAFLSAWAESSLGSGGETVALDSAEALFPPITGFRLENPPGMIRPPGEVVARRFVFDAASLARLRSEAASGGSVVPTRVQAVTALLSRTAARTKTTCSSTPTTEIILHAVNLRPRTNPPLPEKTVGNIWTPVVVTLRERSDGSDGLSDAVVEMRREIENLDVERLKSKEGFGLICEGLRGMVELMKSEGCVSFLKFSSWVRFPIYEVDFGFGRPEWAGGTEIPIDGAVVLMRDKGGDGVEALVNLDRRHMASFEADQTLLSFASSFS